MENNVSIISKNNFLGESSFPISDIPLAKIYNYPYFPVQNMPDRITNPGKEG